MQTSKAKWMVVWAQLALASVLVLIGAGISGARAGDPVFRSPEAALKQGLGAYRGGYYDIAIPALKFAASEDSLLAKYYLAKIYADNLGARTDHVRAYRIYKSIVHTYAGMDPDMDPRGPIVGQSMTAYAKYVLKGLSEINLKPNPTAAHSYFNNASTTFNNEDAQFELAKMDMVGDGVPRNGRLARHWLSTLSEKGHAGAQAFLADLLWRGKHVEKDQVQALALIVVAVKNAPPQERLWIEDIYQTIYCGAPKGVRKQVTGIVANWGKRYSRKVRARAPRHALGVDARPLRTCQDGEFVGSIWDRSETQVPQGDEGVRDDDQRQQSIQRQPMAAKPRRTDGFSIGGATAGPPPRPVFGLRSVDTPQSDRR